jgi:hypothetical protein
MGDPRQRPGRSRAKSLFKVSACTALSLWVCGARRSEEVDVRPRPSEDAAPCAHRLLGLNSDRRHLEIGLGHAAIGAGPGVGDVFPAGAWGDALVRQSFGLVVDIAANDAHPGAVSHGGSGFIHWIMSKHSADEPHCPIPRERPKAPTDACFTNDIHKRHPQSTPTADIPNAFATQHPACPVTAPQLAHDC